MFPLKFIESEVLLEKNWKTTNMILEFYYFSIGLISTVNGDHTSIKLLLDKDKVASCDKATSLLYTRQINSKTN